MTDSLGLWWIIPGELAGMPFPRFDTMRYETGGPVDAYADDLPALVRAGIGAVVSFLNLPQLALIYHGTGIAFLSLPVPDGGAPSFEQARQLIAFIDEHRALGRRVAVHCAAGLGRTGTALAAYLIAHGESAAGAIHEVRQVEPAAIETLRQVQFLHDFARSQPGSSSSGQTGNQG